MITIDARAASAFKVARIVPCTSHARAAMASSELRAVESARCAKSTRGKARLVCASIRVRRPCAHLRRCGPALDGSSATIQRLRALTLIRFCMGLIAALPTARGNVMCIRRVASRVCLRRQASPAKGHSSVLFAASLCCSDELERLSGRRDPLLGSSLRAEKSREIRVVCATGAHVGPTMRGRVTELHAFRKARFDVTLSRASAIRRGSQARIRNALADTPLRLPARVSITREASRCALLIARRGLTRASPRPRARVWDWVDGHAARRVAAQPSASHCAGRPRRRRLRRTAKPRVTIKTHSRTRVAESAEPRGSSAPAFTPQRERHCRHPDQYEQRLPIDAPRPRFREGRTVTMQLLHQ